MSADWIIVDGYNVLRQIPEYQKAADDDLETARDRLIDDLATLAAVGGARLTVVFDGSRGPMAAEQALEVRGVEVLFSRRGQTADTVIERLVVRDRGEHRKFVVTSDYAQQKAVFRDGVYRRTPSELVQDIRDAIAEVPEPGSGHLVVEERLDGDTRRELRGRARRPRS